MFRTYREQVTSCLQATHVQIHNRRGPCHTQIAAAEGAIIRPALPVSHTPLCRPLQPFHTPGGRTQQRRPWRPIVPTPEQATRSHTRMQDDLQRERSARRQCGPMPEMRAAFGLRAEQHAQPVLRTQKSDPERRQRRTGIPGAEQGLWRAVIRRWTDTAKVPRHTRRCVSLCVFSKAGKPAHPAQRGHVDTGGSLKGQDSPSRTCPSLSST